MLQQIKTISAYHRLMGLPAPEHPLISVVRFEDIKALKGDEPISLVNDFYSIGLKHNFGAKMKYGQQTYDFDGGMMTFMAPGQVLRIEVEPGRELKHTGWLLLVHADFLWHTTLARKIKQYAYFSYAVSEALHLSEKEEAIIAGMLQNIEREYHSNIDRFSQEVMVSQLESILTYAERFYHRQFLTRKISSHQLLERFEAALQDWPGIPTVSELADNLHISPGYLGSVLRVLTGKNTQQHIQDRLIEKAKEKLSTTELSVSEIAYQLGFEYPQSFSKLFKARTSLSPLEFRASFN
ncbi:helix-turn-helix transcriptional regulator [Mucilaginibacter rubeus]|uniref:Helix-turn-helix transcriptional regulator n=1 Tax=Mucilaginibacter rubeus TaxID=2027860 RepID=A0AAE6MIU9_9SPHI|nr:MULTISPECIES: helix-turn-helix transcriptional regulator [Mucilaginibacter]QEM04983.1 helix-turn-helix transcriptional regulator [Mucilaginibacter rubeus]QEM17577.1 helix-turn-helix transcriptional regulator [Mucilaginibacter gossypii]QTE45902.1 helix-turn-helix transcriptional regulator [Mucilaginibacter rubeus]QTE52499.1 helix-turn-helix transcriptional regulator [Mucilaginibacter rubeus]QTE57588.1 helix-turn-helix transcriptional regulator [Mucilaginibacter rubeus]